MAQSLFTLENIIYVAGRHYTHNGVEYAPGEVIPDAKTFRNVEAMVNSRHLYLGVENYNDVPVYYQKDVKDLPLIEAKLNRKIIYPRAPQIVPDPDDQGEDQDKGKPKVEPKAKVEHKAEPKAEHKPEHKPKTEPKTEHDPPAKKTQKRT